MSEIELSDRQFITVWMDYFGIPEGMRMLGWCLWMSGQGAKSFADVRDIVNGKWGMKGLGTRASFYHLAKLREFRLHYASLEGRELAEEYEVITKLVGSMLPGNV